MPLRKSKEPRATKAKETDQVSDRTDDLVAALEAAKEASPGPRPRPVARGRAGQGGQQAADKAADKLMPERARQRRREAARRRNKRLLAGTAILAGLGVLASRLAGGKGAELRESKPAGTPADDAPRWDRPADPGPGASAEVTQLHTDGAGGDPARTPPS